MNIDDMKLNYLRNNTSLSPINRIKLYKLKKHNVSENEIKMAEYAYRFMAFENSLYKMWKQYDIGNTEDMSLRQFAEHMIEQEVYKQQSKMR